jgi:hypothetical protein
MSPPSLYDLLSPSLGREADRQVVDEVPEVRNSYVSRPLHDVQHPDLSLMKDKETSSELSYILEDPLAPIRNLAQRPRTDPSAELVAVLRDDIHHSDKYGNA